VSAFHVGQRVRIVEGGYVSPEERDGLGREARIIVRNDLPDYDWTVKDTAGCEWEVVECCLEPILPDGHRPAELTVEELLPFLREQVTA
jgi:hypothetical protein